MKKKLYKKTVFFVISLFAVLFAASVILTFVYIRSAEKKIISETSAYIKNYLRNLETSDYSFSAEILGRLETAHEGSSSFTEEAENILSSFLSENGDSFNEWLYGKNLKTFFKTAVRGSAFLESADIFSIADMSGRSLLFSGKNREYAGSDLKSLSASGSFTRKNKSFCRYTEKIDSIRFSPAGSSASSPKGDMEKSPEGGGGNADIPVRVLELNFNFSDFSLLIIKNILIFSVIIIAAVLVFFLYLLPEIKFYFEGRLLNIRNSLYEIIKGNRDVRIYLPGDDVMTEIGSAVNSILDESVHTDSELCSEKKKFNILFENMPAGVVVLDAEGKLVYENSFIKSLFTGDYEPFPGVFYTVLNRADSDMLFENLSYVLSGEKREYSHRCRLFRGAFRHQFFEINIRSAFEKDRLKFVIITFIDLSSGGVRENSHLDYFRTGGMSRLAGTIANGLNNILQIINGYTEYLLLGGFDEDEFREVVENMIDAARRASVLTRHLKIFSREKHLGESVPVNMKHLVRDLETILREIFHSGIVFSISDDGTEAECRGDESQLEQVIINLCINAGEAVSGEGTVEISTGTAEYSEEDVHGYPEAGPGKYIYVKVKDSGSGIPEEQIRKIFEPFYSTKKNGEAGGMGLSLSYSIVMSHKGFIQIESAEGIGSTFTVNIPAQTAEKPAEAAEEAGILPQGENQGKTILFVDDEELILSLGKIMLEKAGYNVLTASGGYEAVNFVKNYDGEIDLMVFDLVMPDISGREAVEMINKFKTNIPVLYISGYAEKELDTATGDYNVLGKPFKSSDLISRISAMLEKK